MYTARAELGRVDAGAAERENDDMSAALHDHVATLRNITQGLSDEAESQNRLLDSMGSSMDGVGGLLGRAQDKFKAVFHNFRGESKRNLYTVAAIVSVGLLLWLAVRR